MELTQAHYERIAHVFPKHRGNVSLGNLAVLNAIVYVAEQGCKWRALPSHFGNWHTIYMRMNRWAKRGVLDRAFAKLQRLDLIRVRVEVPSPDSTVVTGHTDGTGAEKKTVPRPSGSRAGGGAPSFSWWRRRGEAQSDSHSPGDTRAMRPRGAPC